MFGIGLPELIIILVVALLVVGPAKLPELAKTLGRSFSQFKRMADDLKTTLDEEITIDEGEKDTTGSREKDEKQAEEGTGRDRENGVTSSPYPDTTGQVKPPS